MWQTVAVNCGFGTPNRDRNQPTRATPEIAAQVQQVYVEYLAKIEDILYKQMYKQRLTKIQAANGGSMGQDGSVPAQMPGGNFGPMSHPNQSYAALLAQAQAQMQGGNITPQLMETVNKAAMGNGMALSASQTDQQRRYIEEQRRLQAQQQGQAPNRTPTMGPPITPTAAAGSTPQLQAGMMTAANPNPHALTVQNMQMLQNMQGMGGYMPGQGGNTMEAQQAVLQRFQQDRQAQQQKDMWNVINTIRNDVSLVQSYIKSRERSYVEKCLSCK